MSRSQVFVISESETDFNIIAPLNFRSFYLLEKTIIFLIIEKILGVIIWCHIRLICVFENLY